MTETQFTQTIQNWIDDHHGYSVKNIGSVNSGSGRPDLYICWYGYFLGLEIKLENNHPSMFQTRHLTKIQKAGGIGIVVYPHNWEFVKRQMLILKKISQK